jgi:hypothetical protein
MMMDQFECAFVTGFRDKTKNTCVTFREKGQVNPIVFFIIIWLGRGRVGLRVALLDYFITKNTDSHPYALLNSFIFCPPVVFI